ncbi:MAG: hypothetical protein K0R11_2373 [Acidimicrobiales bacterium]|nr:hypothetical protein [Acidimicrobiales bacterium]
MHPKSSSRSHVRAGPSSVKNGTSSGSVSPSTSVDTGLTIPAFSAAMWRRVGPSTAVWSRPTLVTTATTPSATLVASWRPAMPTSRTTASTGRSANQRKAARVSASKRVGRTPLDASRAAMPTSTSASSSSEMGSPLRDNRSLTRSRSGLV